MKVFQGNGDDFDSIRRLYTRQISSLENAGVLDVAVDIRDEARAAAGGVFVSPR